MTFSTDTTFKRTGGIESFALGLVVTKGGICVMLGFWLLFVEWQP